MALPRRLRSNPLLLVGLASAALQAALVVFAPARFLETRVIVDDTFYYWMIARRWWEAGFLSFDGIHPTNGFQPLWQYLLLPLGALPQWLQLRLSLLLSVATYQAAGWLLLLWRREASDPGARACRWGGVLWLSNPRLLLDYGSSGMEFGLYAACVAWGVLAAADAWRALGGGSGLSRRECLAVLLPTAIVPLARVDGLGLSGVLWAMLLVRGLRRGGLGSALRLVPWGLAATVPFLLHGVASHAAFDSFLPVSGTVKRLDRLAELRERGVAIGSAAWLLDGAKAAASLVAGNTARFFGGFLPPAPWSRTVVAGAAGVVLLGLLAWRTLRAGWRGIGSEFPAEALLLAPAIAVQIALYSAVIPGGMQYGQWYWGPGYWLLALAAGVLLAPLDPRAAVLPGCAWLGLAAGMLVVLPQPVETQTGGLREVLARLKAETRGEPVRVGAWNAGIVAWLAPGNATVVNLDGLVNSTEFARNHAGDRDRRAFVRDAGIRYLADYALGAEEDAWRRVLEIRLGPNPGPVGGVELALEPLLVTEPVATPSGVPRRYHLLRVAVEN